jgi:hypothetical protein
MFAARKSDRGEAERRSEKLSGRPEPVRQTIQGIKRERMMRGTKKSD